MEEGHTEDNYWSTTRTLACPVYSQISLPEKLFDIVDTPQYQRLRNIKQTGPVHYVFPGSVGTRFMHCLGTAYLAQNWIRQIKQRQPGLKISEQDILNVTTAGLVHDLGHAPLSHTFERWMHSSGHPEWNHEVMGGKLFDRLIEVYNLDWDRADVKTVQGMILGDTVDPERPWLSQIVSNEKTGVDVDKFDYIKRDADLLGLSTTFRAQRLIDCSRVIDGEICFLEKEALNVYELLHNRFLLHKRAYQHKVAQAVEHMIYDVLTAAQPSLNLIEWAGDLERYHLFTDSIFDIIKTTRGEETAAARNLLKRIDERDFYPLVARLITDSENIGQLQSLTSEQICGYQVTDGSLAHLTPDDIIIHRSAINYGKGSTNAAALVRYYDKHNVNESYNIPKYAISEVLPVHFQDFVVRIFLRGDKSKLQAATKAVSRFSKRHHLQIKRR